MGTVETAFAYAVAILAAVAVVGALVAVLVWEWCAIKRTLAANRPPTPEETFWQQHAAVAVPERPTVGGGLRKW
jgi:hypothetical protein